MRQTVEQGRHSVLTGLILSSLLLGSCSAAPRTESSANAPAQSARSMEQAGADSATVPAGQSLLSSSSSAAKTTTLSKPKAQLIKTATLALRVKQLERTIQSVTTIITSRGGDVLSLQETVPRDNAYHTASFQFRVPQDQLDGTLTQLSTLGTVESRSIQAEDVANQIVDFDARLNNLRKTESVVLGIMNRSGSVGDVLKVSQELSRIRGEIEQIQAQVQHLRQQVAYSTINLTLKETLTQNQPGVSIGERLQETWSQSTHAVGKTTTNLLQLAIWLLVFSPYLVGTVVLILLLRRLFRRNRSQPQQTTPSEN